MKVCTRKVKPVEVYAVCDRCNIHYPMIKSAKIHSANPTIYTYVCNNCGHMEQSSEDYPRIEYR